MGGIHGAFFFDKGGVTRSFNISNFYRIELSIRHFCIQVFTFVDGSALPVVNMKYPYNTMYGHTKLVTFIGHQESQSEPNAFYKSPSSKKVKFGPLMIFTGRFVDENCSYNIKTLLLGIF